MERENISAEEALYILKKDDHERRQWGLRVFGVDTWDPSLYDMVIHIHKITVDSAVDIICNAVVSERFKATAESEKALSDLVLASRVKAALVSTCPSVRVSAKEGVIFVDTMVGPAVAEPLVQELRSLANEVQGVKKVTISVTPTASFFSD